MKRLLLVGFAKFILIYLPTATLVFMLLYFCSIFLIQAGYKNVLFIPAAAAIGILLLLFRLILGSTMVEIKRLHKMGQR